MELDKIYNRDCLEGMRGLPDNSVDCVITSPPYNLCLRVRGDKYTHRTNGEKRGELNVNKYTNGLSDSLEMQDYFYWQCKCIDEMMRVSTGMVFYNIQAVTGNKWAVFKLIGKYADNIREVLIWDKMGAEPAIGERILNSEYEFIIVLDHKDCKGRQFTTFNSERGKLSNIIRIGKNHENEHRAAFPLSLPRHLIHYFTPVGGAILDPFIGSGTTAIAAIKEKRHFIGFEINKEYYEKACRRIDIEQRQLTLF